MECLEEEQGDQFCMMSSILVTSVRISIPNVLPIGVHRQPKFVGVLHCETRLIGSLVGWLVRSFVHLSFIHSFVHSFFLHSFIF